MAPASPLDAWESAWRALGIGEPPGLLGRLLAAYREPPRRFIGFNF
jgi:hypothetical protein